MENQKYCYGGKSHRWYSMDMMNFSAKSQERMFKCQVCSQIDIEKGYAHVEKHAAKNSYLWNQTTHKSPGRPHYPKALERI